MRGIHWKLFAACVWISAAGCTLISSPADYDDGRDAGIQRDGAPPIVDSGTPDTAMPDAGPQPPCTGDGCFGKPCLLNAMCMSGNCTDLRALRLASVPTYVCSQTCMRASDCPGGTVCWDSGSGVRACAQPSWINQGQTNAGTEKASCTEDSDCASMICTGGRCVRACGEDDACIGPEVCGRFPSYTKSALYVTESVVPGPQMTKSLPVFSQLACVPAAEPAGFDDPQGTRAAIIGAACTAHKDCASRVCVDSVCRAPCGTSADCPATQGCQQVRAAPAESTHAEWMQVCVPNPMKMLNSGAACEEKADGPKCLDGNCFGDSRTVSDTEDRWCAPSCGVDADCAAYKDDTPARNKLHCVPVLVDAAGGDVFKQHWVMACGK